jgi:hypothetical protein
MVPASIRSFPSTLIAWMTPPVGAGAGRRAGGWAGGWAGGVGTWAEAVPMTSTGIRQAATSRTARIVNKRLVSPNSAHVQNRRAWINKIT